MPLMAVHACLKNDLTEDEKYHNLMNWLIWAGALQNLQNHVVSRRLRSACAVVQSDQSLHLALYGKTGGPISFFMGTEDSDQTGLIWAFSGSSCDIGFAVLCIIFLMPMSRLSTKRVLISSLLTIAPLLYTINFLVIEILFL